MEATSSGATLQETWTLLLVALTYFEDPRLDDVVHVDVGTF
jgi:hypothetical protein